MPCSASQVSPERIQTFSMPQRFMLAAASSSMISFAATISSPDFVMLARAHGLRGVRVSDPRRLDAVVGRAVRARVPTLVEILVEPEADV